MKSISLRSPAKLNLFLKIIKKRTDGYHDLVTLFERIDLCDQICLRLNKSGKIRIFCQDAHVPKGPKNLAYKAARLLKEEFALLDGVDITIRKNIPIAAGLAGGSSNAATALLGLNKLWKLNLKREELIEYAKTLGSDIPFFLHDCSWAIGRKRGDEIQRLNLKQKVWHILVVPALKVYSREAFGAFKLQLTKGYDDVNILTHALRKKDSVCLGKLLSNDLETVVFKQYPKLFQLKKTLGKLASNAVLSGSGSALFAVVGSKREAKQYAVLLKKRYQRVFIVRTL
ncbi:MAG: 4-(cytidine 5'-diphospho)-2-C-methyl-D-erythritol kinase [Candidatus Omnitrophota bacterium]